MRLGLLALLLPWTANLAAQALPATPQEIVSAADSSPASLGLPPGSLFTIYGANLASATATATPPYPSTLAGAAVHFRSGNAAIDAPLLYASPSQINGIVPDGLASRGALVSVETSAGESPGQSVPLVDTRFTAFATGLLPFGPAVVQQYRPSGVTLNRLLDPAVPGDALVIWGTGLGSAVRQDVTVYVGDTPIVPFYAGPAPGQPGLSQINVYLPEVIPSRCFLPLTVRTGSRNSTVYTISTASAAGSDCDSEIPLSRTARETLDQGGTIRIAALSALAPEGGTATAEAWQADYNSAYLSQIATYDGPAAAPIACTRSSYSYDRYSKPLATAFPAPFYGLRRSIALIPSLAGGSGCAWPFTLSADGVYRAAAPVACPAQQFTLRDPASGFSFSGALPAAPVATAPAITLTRSAATLPASWVNPAEARLTLDFSSSFTLSGNIFNGQTTVRQLTCRLSGSSGSGEIPLTDFDWAMGLPSSQSMSFHLSTAAAAYGDWSTPGGAALARASRVLSGPVTVR